MKTIWKKLSAALVTAVMAAAVVVPAAAANAYTPVAGTTTTFKKYLVADLDAQIPASVFSFTVAAGTAIPAESGKMEVLAGPDADDVIVTPASFAASETLSSTVAEGDDVTLAAGQGYAKKVVTVNLSAVSFDEPGIYRYIITESATTIPGMNIDPTPARTLDVYVTDDGSGVLAVSSYVLHTGTAAPAAGANNGSGDVATANAPVADKSDGYTNTYGTHNLWVGKTVTGNQGSRDKYFKIHVEVTGLVNGTEFTVKYNGSDTAATYGNADASITADPNAATTCISADVTQPSELTAAGGKITQDFYLQSGQHFVICGLPVGAEYTVSEDAEDYKSEDGATALGFTDDTTGTISDTDVKTGFTNTRDGIIPTGILMSVAPVAIVGVVVLAGVVFFAVRSAKRKAEEAAEADAE